MNGTRVIFATTVLLLSSTMGFLLDNDCHVTPLCDCTTSVMMGNDYVPFVGVLCEGKSLTRVPTFRNTSYKMTQPWTIDLQDNLISYIPDNAFSNLQEYANGNNISVRLGMNNLGNISDSAFSGIETLITFIGLNRNHLQIMPPFISNLPNLKGLNVLYNPITHIDPSFFTSAHETLKTLKISVGDLPFWPQSLNSLSKLETLEIETKHQDIPVDAFAGLNDTLRDLTTINVDLFNATTLCGLSVLENLIIQFSTDITGDNILNCALSINSVKSIRLQKLSTNRFIDFLGIFPNVEKLEYWVTGLSFIDESLIPNGVKVTLFECNTCKLKSVPGAINLFRRLETCYLFYNDITTVERYSFDKLQHLQTIGLSKNPIIYISRFSFRNLVALETLYLAGTELTIIPQAVTTLPNLQYLYMGSNITCACGPHWMKQWATSITQKPYGTGIDGGCHASNETFRHFVLHTLPDCP